MSRYSYAISKSAGEDLKKLDKVTKSRIANKLQYFIEQKDPLAFARPLINSSIGSYRFRIGHYRIVFDINGDTLVIHDIKHRKDVYKR